MAARRSRRPKSARRRSGRRSKARRARSGGRFRGGEGRYRATQDWAQDWKKDKLYVGVIQVGSTTSRALFQYLSDAWFAFSIMANGDPMSDGFEVTRSAEVTSENAQEARGIVDSFPQWWHDTYASIMVALGKE